MIFREKDFAEAEVRSASAVAIEFRDSDCGRVEGGKFGPKNDCASDGTSTSTKPARDNSWKKKESGPASWTGHQMFSGKSPIRLENAGILESLSIEGSPKKVSETLGSLGIDLDAAVSLGGGIVRDAKIEVYTIGGSPEGVGVQSDSPVQPGDVDSRLRVGWSVFMGNADGKKQIDLEGFYLPEKYSADDEDVTPEDKRRITSLMMEGVITSLTTAEKNGFDVATTFAVGDKQADMKGYRLWPKFGFDGPIGANLHASLTDFARRQIRGDETSDWAADLIDAIDEADWNGATVSVQDVIASREGQKWWDANGADIDLTLDFSDKSSPGYKRFKQMQKRMGNLRGRNEQRSALLSPLDLLDIFDWADEDGDEVVESRDDNCGRTQDGTFAPKNDCAAGDGPVEKEVKVSKKRNVDVMIGGGKRVAVMDAEAKQRAAEDSRDNPKPEGSSPGSTTDLWARDFAVRGDGSNKISSHSPVFPPETHRQNGQYIAHEAVGQFLADRHEEQRRAVGADGPGAIIDTTRRDIPQEQMDYIVDSLAEDAIHAYEVLQVDPGFYSSDLDRTMETMSQRHPELATDENAKFMFTMLTAITSSGQSPDANLADADGLYEMWKQHGTVVPSSYGGGSRDVSPSLRTLQGLVDSFGVDRTRRLLSGYTTASNINKTFKRLAEKSADPDWKGREGEASWELPTSNMVGGELVDEVVPVAAIFGPKIGSFYANLSGRHDFVTMDRWLMRSVGRVTGELLTRSTPDQAKRRAEAALMAIESGKWRKEFLFGVDKKHGIKKEDLVRSLKIQAATGVIEESGAAYIWATAAERSHQKTPRPSGGGYGKHPDPVIHSMHQAGNSMFKSLIHEQQDPRSGVARRNIREVFRQIQDRIEQKSGRRPDADEIQAALWQYEKTLWKHLGAKGKVEKDSLFSSAATGLQSGKIRARKFTPASRRDAGEQSQEFDDDDFDVYQHDAEQTAFVSDVIESGVDVVEWLAGLEDDIEERRNFAPLYESRNDCGRDASGRFGPKNDCASDGGGVAAVAAKADTSWLDDSGSVTIDESDVFSESPPFTGAETLREFHVESAPALKNAMQGFDGIGSIDDVISVGGGSRRGASIQIGAYWSDDEGDIRVSTSLPVAEDGSDSRGYIRSLVSLYKDDMGVVSVEYDNLVPDAKADEYLVSYDDDSPAEHTADRRRVSSILLERMTESLTSAEDIGASRAFTYAAGNAKSLMQGYRLWPQFGFDADLSPHMQQTIKEASDEGDLSLTDQQQEKLADGLLTIQGLIATRDGDRWWNANGNSSNMTLDFRDKESLGYKRFEGMKKKLARLKKRNEGRDWSMLDELEFRDDGCGRQEGGRFAAGNDCASDGGIATASPSRDDSWMEGQGQLGRTWSGDAIRESPPITGGEEMAKVAIGGGIDQIKETMRSIPEMKSLDDLAVLSGGVRKGGTLTVIPGLGGTLRVKATLPVFPDDPQSGAIVDTTVIISPGVLAKDFATAYRITEDQAAEFAEPPRIEYETFSVGREIAATGEKKNRISSHLMQRMAESLATAERLGMIAETHAAGRADEGYLKGYYLWPRFGFDATLPPSHRERVRQAVSEGGLSLTPQQASRLSADSITVQELTSTREGQVWWEQNGRGLTLTLDFSKKDTPGYRRYQKMLTMVESLKKRNQTRSADDWMLEVEWRADDCGANQEGGGGFTQGNTCAAGASSGGRKAVAPGDATKRIDSGEKPSSVMQSMGFRRMNFSAIDKALEGADPKQRARILADLDTLAEAIAVDDRIADIPVRVGSINDIFKNDPDAIEGLKSGEADGGSLTAAADAQSGTLAVFTDHDEYDSSEYAEGWNSSDHRAAPIVHEVAHLEHFKSVAEAFPYPGEDELPGVDPFDYAMTEAESAAAELLRSEPSLIKKIEGVSEYATTDIFEFVAEYSTAVHLGDMKNDKDLDRLCEAVGARPPKRLSR